MILKNNSNKDKQKFDDPESEGVYITWLFGKDTPAPNFHMRKLQIMPKGFTPHHQHPFEHQVYVSKGEGLLVQGDNTTHLHNGDSLLIEPDEIHQFRNISTEIFEFICIIPKV